MREGRREAEIEEGKEGSRDRGREEGTQRFFLSSFPPLKQRSRGREEGKQR